MLDVMARYLAKVQNRDATLYTDIHVEASPGGAYSTLTLEDFSCSVSYKYDGAAGNYFMDESEVVEFLNFGWSQ